MNDMVSHPPHYTIGKVETINVIEDTIQHAPDAIAGYLQGQVIKYIARLWHKGNALQDAQKAGWYLTRLQDHLVLQRHLAADSLVIGGGEQ